MSNCNESKSIKKTGMVLLQKIIEKLIPGGDIATTIFDLVNEGKRAIDKDKFHNFVMGIQEYDEGDIDVSNESFIALVKRLYLDDESSKTDMYARLAVELAKSNLNPHEKIYYINILSNLTYTDIQLSKKYIAYELNHIVGFKGITEQLLSITKTTSGIELKSINSLLSNGLIYEENETVNVYKASDELIKFTSMIFSFKEINSNGYGIELKEKYDVLIVKERILQPMTNEYRENIEIKEFCDYIIGKFSSDDVRISSIYWDEWKKYEVTTRQFLFIIPDGDDFRIYSSSDVNTLYSFMKGESLNLMSCMLLNKKDYLNTSLIEDIKENLEFIGKDKYI